MKKYVISISLFLSIFFVLFFIVYKNNHNNLMKKDQSVNEFENYSVEETNSVDNDLTNLLFHEECIYLTDNNTINFNSNLDILTNYNKGTIYIIKKNNHTYDIEADISFPINKDYEYLIEYSGYYRVIFVDDTESDKSYDITSFIGIGIYDTIN